MSREIDIENLSEDDKLYIAHRPSLREEIRIQTGEDPLEDFDLSVLNPNDEEAYGQVPPSGDDSEEVSDWNKSMPKEELLAAIVARNEGREEDELITVADFEGDLAKATKDDFKKDHLIAALQADDES